MPLEPMCLGARKPASPPRRLHRGKGGEGALNCLCSGVDVRRRLEEARHDEALESAGLGTGCLLATALIADAPVRWVIWPPDDPH